MALYAGQKVRASQINGAVGTLAGRYINSIGGSITSTAAALSYDTLQTTTSLVSASGTSNNTFTLNATGGWLVVVNFRGSCTIAASTLLEAFFVRVVSAGADATRYGGENALIANPAASATSPTVMFDLTVDREFNSGQQLQVYATSAGASAGLQVNTELNSITFHYLGA